VVTESPVPAATLAALEESFSQSDLPWRVDVIDWASTSESFKTLIGHDLAPLY
jgi:hypothetical protein